MAGGEKPFSSGFCQRLSGDNSSDLSNNGRNSSSWRGPSDYWFWVTPFSLLTFSPKGASSFLWLLILGNITRPFRFFQYFCTQSFISDVLCLKYLE